MPTPLSRRLSTWFLATRWALWGRPADARVLQEQMASLPLEQAPPPPEHEWQLQKNGWEGDRRWVCLVGHDDELPRHPDVVARGTWYMAHALTAKSHAVLEPVFWAALRRAAQALELPESSGGDAGYEADLHNKRIRMARAWLSVAPEHAEGPLWSDVWTAFQANNPSPGALVAGAMLAVLVEPPDQLDSSLKDVPLEILRSAGPSEWPWIPWLVLTNACRRLAVDLRQEGGPLHWPGLTAWQSTHSLRLSLERRSEASARALQARHAPRPTNAENKKATVFSGAMPWFEGEYSAVSMAARFGLKPALRTLLACASPCDQLDEKGLTALDRAVRDKTMGTAKVLVEGGARFGLERKNNVKQPWNVLFNDQPNKSAEFRKSWQSVEAALWKTRGVVSLRSWTESQRSNLIIDATSHPHAAETAKELVRVFGVGVAYSCEHSWQLSKTQEAPVPLMRSALTLAAQNPHWLLADKEAFVSEVFRANDTRASAVLDNFEDQKVGAKWATPRYRSASALVWATVYAPQALEDLLKRSTSAEIDEALNGAGSWVGWGEGDEEGNASAAARGVAHTWHKHHALWMQAACSADPVSAMAKLAAHPRTRADRDVRRPVQLGKETLELSALEHAMVLADGSHTALAMLRSAGAPSGPVDGRALRTWCKAPRDLETLRAGFELLESGSVDQPLDSNGSTLLMHALEEQDRALVGMLLDLGANLDARSADGRSPRVLAEAAGPEWAALLSAAAANRLECTLHDATPSPARPRL